MNLFFRKISEPVSSIKLNYTKKWEEKLNNFIFLSKQQFYSCVRLFICRKLSSSLIMPLPATAICKRRVWSAVWLHKTGTGTRGWEQLWLYSYLQWNCINDYMANDDGYVDDYVIEPFSVLNSSRGFIHMVELISTFNSIFTQLIVCWLSAAASSTLDAPHLNLLSILDDGWTMTSCINGNSLQSLWW